MQLDDGSVLTEGPAIVQYLADRKPESGLAPANGTMERYRLQEMLGYINSELHKSFSPLFNKATLPEVRKEREEYLRKRFALVEKILGKGPYLFGEKFTAADAYLFVVTNWVECDISAINAGFHFNHFFWLHAQILGDALYFVRP